MLYASVSEPVAVSAGLNRKGETLLHKSHLPDASGEGGDDIAEPETRDEVPETEVARQN